MAGVEIMKVEITRTKWKKHKPPPYIDVVFEVSPDIDLSKLALNHPDIEYCSEGYNCAYLKTEFGTLEIKRTAVIVPRFPIAREAEIINVKRYVQALLCGEKKSFVNWVRQDLKKFVKEEMEL